MSYKCKSRAKTLSEEHCSTVAVNVGLNREPSNVFNTMKVIRPRRRSNCLFS